MYVKLDARVMFDTRSIRGTKDQLKYHKKD